MRLTVTLLAIALLAVPAAVRAGCGAPVDECHAAACAARPAIDQACPCGAAENFGRYRSCAADTIRRLTDEGTIPPDCRGKLTRCAAESTCGMPGFVLCRIDRTGSCRPEEGHCAHDTAVACKADSDCVVKSHCMTSPSAEACEAKGGKVGAGTNCCPTCATH